MEGGVLGGGGDEVSIMPVVSPRETVSASSLGSILFVGSSFKTSHTSLPIYLGAHHIQENFKNNRRRNLKPIKPQEENASHQERRNQVRVKVRANLVVGYWYLIPMESGANNSK